MNTLPHELKLPKVLEANPDYSSFHEIFKSGFNKVSSIIDANPAYGSILGYRIERAEYNELSDRKGFIPCDKALSFLENSLERRSVVKRVFSESELSLRFLCYGATNNNKREFNFFLRKAEELGFFVELLNIEELPGERVKVENSKLKLEIVSSYSEFLKGRASISKSLLHQTVSYALSLLAAWETMHEVEPSLFIVANDHSPAPVAYAKVAEAKNVKILYLQHAEITGNFPPLDFDYSILRNEISFDIYARKKMSGKVVFCDRSSIGFSQEELLNRFERLKAESKVSVVIYPSGVFDDQAYKRLVSELLKNELVDSLSVKFHPSFKDFERVRDGRVTILDELPDDPHVAVCGNSSVVVELVAKGNLVFNYFDLDDISRDYYGFVDKKISRILEIKNASKPFWKDVKGSEILPSLSKYMPSVGSVRNRLEVYRVKEAFSEILSENVVEDVKKIWFERDIFLFGNSILNLLRNKKSIPYEDFWTISNLNRLFDNRDARLQSLYEKANIEVCSSVFEFWLNTKVMEWNGRIPSSEQLSVHASFVESFKGHRKVKGWLELKFFDVVIRFGKANQVLEFLRLASVLDIYRIGINKKISFLNYINSNSEEHKALLEFYDVNKDRYLTALDKVKIVVQSGIKMADFPMPESYRDVEDAFTKSHPCIFDEYMELVRKPYNIVGNRACFIDIKRNPDEENGFVQLIKDRIRMGKGFSFIRLSDGEGFIFQDLSGHFTKDDSKNRQRHWWGEEIPAEIQNCLISDLLKAVEAADVLGIPSVYRFVRDHSDKTVSLKQSLQGRGLIAVLASLKYVDTPNKLYTDDKANIAVLNKIEVIAGLAKKAKKVIVVNSGSINSVREAFSGFFDFDHIQVPTHNKTSLNEKYHSSSRPLPYVYRDVANKIESSTIPGTLVLVGAGVAGKVFMHSAQKQGGVALDLGSAMDQFLSGGIHSLF